MPDSIEDLRQKMNAKLLEIPLPPVNKLMAAKNLNQIKDTETTHHTIQILRDRRKEAIESGDAKKYFHAVSIEANQVDEYNIRERERELQSKLSSIKNSIPKPDWTLLEQFSELKNPQFWIDAEKKGGFTEQEKHQYYRDVLQIETRVIIKFLDYLKVHHTIQQLSSVNK